MPIHPPSLITAGIIILMFILLFGPTRIPIAARCLGKVSSEFRRGLREDPLPDPLPPPKEEQKSLYDI